MNILDNGDKYLLPRFPDIVKEKLGVEINSVVKGEKNAKKSTKKSK